MDLEAQRAKLKDREDKVEKAISKEAKNLDHLEDEIQKEREELDDLHKRRKQLKKELDEEIKLDEKGKGEHKEGFDQWVDDRRDELADMIDASEARLNRLVERVAKNADDLKKLKKRDEFLDERIERVNKKIARKKDKKGQLTKDFHISEFDCNNGTPVPSYMEASLRSLCEKHLQPLRNSGGSIHINSGYRTAAYNASIGGASQSYHVYDVRKDHPAADHVQAGRSATEVQRWHDSHNPPDGMGYYPGFTHIDDRGYRSRWYGAS